MPVPRTAINQAPNGGSFYPFMASGVLQDTITDFYLSYSGDYVLPFNLTVSSNVFTVTDANDDTIAVGATVDAVTRTWGTRTVLEWTGSSTVMRAVIASTPDDNIATLDPRTCNKVPRRVTSITASTLQTAETVTFQAGYNIALSGDDGVVSRIEGGRYVTTIDIDAVAGAGTGRVDGCTEGPLVIRKINLIEPSCSGNFVLDTDACFRAQLATQVTGASGTSRTGIYHADALSTAEAKASITLESDCKPCCDCDYFVRTYAGLKRVWDKWKTTAASASAIRDLYEANRARWLAARECRLANPGNLVATTDASCKTFIGGSFCNFTPCCLTAIELRFTLQKYNNGVLVPWTSGSVVDSYVIGSPFSGDQRYTPAKTGPVVRFFVDYANHQATTAAKFKFCTTDCTTTQSLGVTMTTHVATPSSLHGECDMPVVSVPSVISSIWTANGVPSGDPVRSVVNKVVALNPNSPKFNCGC